MANRLVFSLSSTHDDRCDTFSLLRRTRARMRVTSDKETSVTSVTVLLFTALSQPIWANLGGVRWAA